MGEEGEGEEREKEKNFVNSLIIRFSFVAFLRYI